MFHRPSSEGPNFYVMDLMNEKERLEIISQYVSQFEPRYQKAVTKAFIDGLALGLKVGRDKIDEICRESLP